MDDGLYRLVVPKRDFHEAVRVENGRVYGAEPVYDGDPVDEFLAREAVFTRVYPIHLPDDMWEEVHNEALAANISDDDIVETAVRYFMRDALQKEV